MIFDAIRRRSQMPNAALGNGGENDVLVRALTGHKSVAGVSVNENTVLTYSAMWAAIRIIAQTVGSVSWHAMQRRDGGKFVAEDHVADELLNIEPNPDMSSLSWRESMACCAILFGNAYAEVKRTRGESVLQSVGIPIHPGRVKLDRNGNGALIYKIRADPVNGDTRDATVPAKDMYHLKGFGGNGLMGYFMLKIAKESVGHGMAVDRFGATWFGNGAHSSGFIKYPGILDKEAKKRVRETLEAVHGPMEKWNKLAVLDEGMDWVATTVSPEQSQFLQTRTFNVTEVSRWTGVPPHMLAELSRATFSNIEHMSIEFVRHAIRPWAVRFETEADRKLFERPREAAFFTKMNLKALVRGDTKTQGEFYRIMRRIGAFSVNDILELEDRNPIGAEGDIRIVERNMVPLSELLQPQPAGVSGASNATAKSDLAEQYKTSSVPVFVDTAERLVGIECERVPKAGKKYKARSQDFKDWCDTFYDNQVRHAFDSFDAAVTSLVGLICDGTSIRKAAVKEMANKSVLVYLKCHMLQVKSDVKDAFASNSIDDLCGVWKICRAAEMSEQLTNCIGDTVLECITEVTNEANTS